MNRGVLACGSTALFKNRAKFRALKNTLASLQGRAQRTQATTATNQALRRDRPLARRALIMARPPRVLMRARNPWVRFLFTSLGWKVRFIVSGSCQEIFV